MDDKKRNITGSYPGAGGSSQPKKNRNPSGFYPGKMKDDEPTRIIPRARQAERREPLEEKPLPVMPEAEPVQPKPVEKKRKFKLRHFFSKDLMKKYRGALIYYTGILVASILLSAWICHVGNEVLGLIRPDKEVTVTVEKGSNLYQIGKQLKKADVIDHPRVFQLYCKLKKAGSKFHAGEFTVNCKGDYNQIIRTLSRSVSDKTAVSFTIQPGDTQEDLVVTLTDSLGYLEREELEAVLQEYDFSDYSFLKNLPKRNYRLEGYLYPDTYEMYEGESALAVVQKILDRFEEKVLTKENQAKIKASKYSLDQLVTLASILQKEGGSDLPHGAGVYYNRLADEKFPYLQSQATVGYILPAGHGAVTASDIKTADPYNTYRNAGLPTGPISNPGADALGAVLTPMETEDLYFVTQSNGETFFAKDQAEHQNNLKKAGENARGTGTVG